MNTFYFKKVILHIIIKSSYDGAAAYPVRLIERMKEYDHTIISCFKGNAYEEILAKGIKCENLIKSGNISYKYLLLKYWRLIKYLRKNSFDIIHYHQGGIGILLFAYFFRKKAKVIHHLHSGNLIGDNTKQNILFLHTFLLKYLSRRTYQIAVADHVTKEYSQKISLTGNLFVIKNSTPFTFQHKKKTNKAVGFIGRYTKEKGFPLFSDVARQLKSAHLPVRVDIMGENQGNFVTQIKNENINIIDPSFKVENFYHSIDLLLFLSTAPEGMPLVVLEAISFDIGVIAFPNKGVIEILGNDYPLYVKSSEEVLEKLKLYYSDKISLDELSQIHERIHNGHSYEAMLTAIKQLYSQCLNT